ncbi:TonB family protein [Piscinibacter sp.]|uniref:TonB family protein n=1 Tax=Piscinibacter sp. TaxID=1903157 RepID=UPI002BDAC0C2|nr:TonB family protein [Albitalea sp.]HUG25939.1 TonB family protein [Albitalea sp.]
MTAATIVSFRAPVLPWAVALEDEARFRRILRRVLVTAVVVCLVLLLWPRPEEDRTQPVELPPRLAKLVLERELPPPPPPVKQERVKEERPQPSANKPDPARPEPPKSATVPEARRPQPNKPPGEIENARRKAAGVGLLAMSNELAEIRGAPLAVQLKQDIKQGPGVGTGVGVGVGAGTETGTPTRALITSNAAGGSGGINTASYSRNTGGGGLAGRATTLVEGVAGGGGGGGIGGGGVRGGKGNGNGTGGTLQRSGSGKASRSIEEIKLVFERNKGAIYAIYNRALREEPSLQGKVVLELKIAPSGEIVGLRIVSSELGASELERKLLARIRQFDFGAKDVEQMVVTWPVDFLPS